MVKRENLQTFSFFFSMVLSGGSIFFVVSMYVSFAIFEDSEVLGISPFLSSTFNRLVGGKSSRFGLFSPRSIDFFITTFFDWNA